MPDTTDGWNTYACMRVAHTKYCVQCLRHSVVWRVAWARRSYVKRTRGRSCAAPEPDTNCSGEAQLSRPASWRPCFDRMFLELVICGHACPFPSSSTTFVIA